LVDLTNRFLGFGTFAHRHCQLVVDGSGRTSDLKCRYHGSHYGADGRTRRHPDAKNFPKFDRKRDRLETFAVDTVGQPLFIRLSDAVPPLHQWLGEFEELLRLACEDGDRRLNPCAHLTYNANWKIPLDGSLESYHLDEVRAKTFVADPGEEASHHELRSKGTRFHTESRGTSFVERMEEASIRWLTGDFNRRYRHLHLFSNSMESLTKAITLVYQIEPVSARRCEMNVIGLGRGIKTARSSETNGGMGNATRIGAHRNKNFIARRSYRHDCPS